MGKTGADIISLLRNVTGRNDNSNPMFTDLVMLGYVNDFLSLEMPQDVRLYENKTWWEFDLLGIEDANYVDPVPVDLQTLGYSTIGPPIYIAGFDSHWFQDPANFYAKWPETQTYTPQRPVDVLYYNNELVFRAPPDQTYAVKLAAYRVEATFDNNIDDTAINDYLWRYAAYGAALDIFSDFGELEQYNKYYPIFMRYRSLVYARTNQQLMVDRTFPQF